MLVKRTNPTLMDLTSDMPLRAVGRVCSGEGFLLAELDYAPGLRLGAHCHDISNVSLVVTGSLEEESDRGVVVAGPGAVVFKPRGTTHSNRVGEGGATVFSLRFDPTWSVIAAPLREYLWCSCDAALSVMLVLYALSRGRGVGEDQVRIGLAAACDSGSTIGFESGPAWLAEAQRRIHADEGPSRIQERARILDTHPVYFARAFRRHLGTSPREYVRRQRITLAAHRLLSTTETPSRIAAVAGFADQAHLCRCFRRLIGLTPGSYRRLAGMM